MAYLISMWIIGTFVAMVGVGYIYYEDKRNGIPLSIPGCIACAYVALLVVTLFPFAIILVLLVAIPVCIFIGGSLYFARLGPKIDRYIDIFNLLKSEYKNNKGKEDEV